MIIFCFYIFPTSIHDRTFYFKNAIFFLCSHSIEKKLNKSNDSNRLLPSEWIDNRNYFIFPLHGTQSPCAISQSSSSSKENNHDSKPKNNQKNKVAESCRNEFNHLILHPYTIPLVERINPTLSTGA